MNENKVLDEPTENKECADVRAAAECLKAYLKAHPTNDRPFDILRFMADETLDLMEKGKAPGMNNIAIQEGVVGKISKDASSWIAEPWKRITGSFLPSREEGLVAYARSHGYPVYPGVRKIASSGGAGNQTLYRIVAEPLPDAGEVSISADAPKPDITYIALETVKPSWMARLMFGRGLSMSGKRKILYLVSPLFWLALTFPMGWFLWYSFTHAVAPINTQHVMLLLAVALVFWITRESFAQATTLMDDRIALAPDTLIGFGEFGVCLELVSVATEGRPKPKRVLRMVKYAGTCPICKAEVLLDKGDPDFPRRMVGRCEESPREHVFSFDRATKYGYWLRRPAPPPDSQLGAQ